MRQSVHFGANEGEIAVLAMPNSSSSLHSHLYVHAAIDGYPENTTELLKQNGLKPESTPGELLTALYLRYGEEGIYKLQGTFSLVLYDHQKRFTLLYRSFLTGYPLYYVSGNNLLSVSTNPVDLLKRTDVSDRLDMVQMSAVFVLKPSTQKGNVFLDLEEVAQGEMVTISSRGTFSKKRTLDSFLPALNHGTEAEVIVGYRELLEEILKKQMVAQKTYGIMLSSGMDSSTLAALASRILESRGASLRAYSWSLPQYVSADESNTIEKFCKVLNMELDLFNVEAFLPFGLLKSSALLPDTPFVNLYWEMVSHLYERAASDGVDVLLNGHYGDHLYVDSRYLLTDILNDRRFDLLLPSMASIFRHHGYLGAIQHSPALRGFIKNIFSVSDESLKMSARLPQWLSHDAKDILQNNTMNPEYQIDGGYERFASALFNSTTGSGVGRYLNARYGVERIEPYFNSNLINYTLRLPAYMVYQKGQTKYFAREAMRGVLPEYVRTQPRVGVLDEVAASGFLKHKKSVRERLFDETSAWSTFVDRKWMQRQFQTGTRPDAEALLVIWTSLTFSAWQKALKPGGSLYEGEV